MKFEGVKIKDLKAGREINGIYVLKKKEIKTTSSGKPYLDLLFADKSGEIDGKVWETNKQVFEELVLYRLYYVNARVDLWKDVLQLNINKFKIADEEDQKAIMDFIPSAPIPPQNMMKEVEGYIDRIRNTDIKKLVRKLMDLKKEKLLYYPAAKSLHHAVMGGLLYHILRMLKVAESLKAVYTKIDTDLLYAGIILHDIAKIGELTSNRIGISEYSKEGQLLGHIVMGACEIDRIGREINIDEEILLLIKHMIISHHYEPEFGSPKKPMILEAELLHYIDLIDARVYDYENVLEKTPKMSFSEPVWSLDKRKIYNSSTEI